MPYIEMQMRWLGLLLGVAAVSAWLSAPASAKCLPATAQQQRARATVIFDGVALDNPTGTGVQRFRVTRYLKGHGPHIVRVNTGVIQHADGSVSFSSESLRVHRGEHWRIYGSGVATGIISTSLCAGSRRR
jgi:hypothetical protein